MHVELINRNNLDKLYKFEVDNKKYFAEIGFPRKKEYYEYENFLLSSYGLIDEQIRDLGYYYLLMDNCHVIGRINISQIIRRPLNKGELGYRLGKNIQGKGYGTKGVSLVVDLARKKHKLHRLEAGTSSENIPSQRVLEKNGFRKVGIYEKYILINGIWLDNVLYEKIL
ncbi:GNAT family N-acetyltransferase [Miniphocaeibacter halophilus]|uniref:GNAT family N-acetyltransferase n=1 Tax=Miniphocaeibacter halophilus TaxID=2931922 RepID=A0AC61MT10_9FIRM|nr:GNAT family protein [Miniphocaeibacter halophilus]QQK08815.1 GNAT family N-acetyltransferase [Miniphocaeibacter halophilus]